MKKTRGNIGRAPVSRRTFMKVLGASVAASRAPMLLGAEDKAGARPLVLGKDEFTYEVQHDWGRLPGRIRWGDTHGVCFDSRHRMYIFHTVHKDSESGDAVVVFDEDGRFIKSWGEAFRGGAHGIDLRREGSDEFLYFCDTRRRLVVKTTLDGEVLWERGYPKEPGVYEREEQYCPTNVAFAPNGDLYVADGYGSHYIHQYDRDGNWIRTFGGEGDAPGKLRQPHGITVDTRGGEPLVLVADRANRRLQYFTLDGRHVRFVSGDVRLPCHFDEYKGVLLVPDLHSRVTLLDREDRLITQLADGPVLEGFRGKPRESFEAGKFYHPHDAAFDHHGNIFVAEWLPIGRVTKLRRIT